jgi:hypothetical protein
MPRFLPLLVAVLGSTAFAQAEHLYFTTIIPPGCPIVITGTTQSKDFGFQAVVFHNDSEQTVASMHLKVTLSAPGGRELIVDAGHIFISLEPGEQKGQDVFLGRMQSLNQRVKFDHLEIARAMISVDSVDFVDGSRWTADGPVNFEPTDPLPPLRPLPPR